MDVLSDAELEQIATRDGPDSLAAQTLAELRAQRAQDKQVVAFRLGAFYVIGPIPTALEELTFLLAHEVTKHLKGRARDD
jgi:hypothetical protein